MSASAPASPRPVRYVFGPFVLSTRRRELRRDGEVRPLIPRYFDLLVFLVERRADAVHRRDIFDHVWTDVIVSDSALSQAIRTLRRVLDDDSRDPRYIRTVSRHGYQFVHADVRAEEDPGLAPGVGDERPTPATAAAETAHAPAAATPGAAAGLADTRGTSDSPVGHALARLRRPGASDAEREDQRDLAERLHAEGPLVLETLAGLEDGAYARALLRDVRWDVVRPLDVPIADPSTAWHLVRLRLLRAGALAAGRWAAGASGAGVAGLAAGLAGGALLATAPGSTAPASVAPVLGAIGAAAGTAAGAGVGAGLALGEAVWRSHRTTALVGGGALGGLAVGLAAQGLAQWSLAALVGVTLAPGGGLEGLALGAASGLAYAATTQGGGFAAPRGPARLRAVAAVALACGVTAIGLSLAGRPLVGGTVHAIASASVNGQAMLTPLGRLVGEPGFGPLTALLISAAEGAAFGTGLTLGLTRRR